MASGHQPITPPAGTEPRRCGCDPPMCFTGDEGYCCLCGHLREQPPSPSTMRLAEALAEIGFDPS